MNRTDRLVELTRGPIVLDLGAIQHSAEKADGPDWLHGKLCDRFETVVGVDMLALDAFKLRQRGYDIRSANVETMNLDIRADTVVAGELIEHVSNPGLMLGRIHEHVKSDGRLVLSTPNPWFVGHLIRGTIGSMDINAEHTGWYGPIVLRQLLGRHGFHVESVEYVGSIDSWLVRSVQPPVPGFMRWPTLVVVATPL